MEAAWNALFSLKMSVFLMGNSLTHIYACFDLWLIIRGMSELKAISERLRFHPLADGCLRYGQGLSKHTETGFNLARAVVQRGLTPPDSVPSPSSLCTSSINWERDWNSETVLRFPPLLLINMCLSEGCRQVSLKLSSDQRKKAVFWQNKKCPCGPRRPRKAKLSHK